MIHWSDSWGFSMSLIFQLQLDLSNCDVSFDILHLKFTPGFLFLSVPLVIFCVPEVDIQHIVAGWAYASRHTILLGIGVAMSIWCQSKYYSLFADIMSNGHNAAHNEACFYVNLVCMCWINAILVKNSDLLTLLNTCECVCACVCVKKVVLVWTSAARHGCSHNVRESGVLIWANGLIRIQQVLYVEETDVCLGPSIRAKWQMVHSVARQEAH